MAGLAGRRLRRPSTRIGGGARSFNAGGDLALDESYPAGTKWHAATYDVNPTAVNWHLEAFAICATVAA